MDDAVDLLETLGRFADVILQPSKERIAQLEADLAKWKAVAKELHRTSTCRVECNTPYDIGWTTHCSCGADIARQAYEALTKEDAE